MKGKTDQAIRGRVFDAEHGTLGWDRSEVEAIWKRGNNVWHDKWCKDLACFLAAETAGADEQQLAALAPICRSGTKELVPGGMESFIYVQVDGAGAPLRITSCTMHSAIRSIETMFCILNWNVSNCTPWPNFNLKLRNCSLG